MATTVTFTQGVNSITVKAPQHGYQSIVAMNLRYSRTNSGYKIGDYGSPYDSRRCVLSSWLMDSTDMTELAEFFNNIDKGRGNNFTLGLGAGTGFFPFGPDKGDAGNFVCSLYDHKKGGCQFSPFRYFNNQFTIYMVSAPSYTPGAAENEGTLSIGSVTTLRHPQVLPTPDHKQGIVRNVSLSGVVSSVDLGIGGDIYETELELDMKRGNAAALVSYLTTTRNGSIAITTPANTWFFGIDLFGSGTYNTRLLSPEIVITHDNFNLFKTRLKFWLESYSG